MAADPTNQVPVVIAGTGPAGLVAAVTLARNGVRSLLVERNQGLSPLPRATAVSTRTMELLRSWGLEAEVRAGQLDITAVGAWAAQTLASPDGTLMPLGHPDLEQAAAIDRGDRAAAGADGGDLDHRRADHHAEIDRGLCRDRGLAAGNDGHVERRAAEIAGDEIVEPGRGTERRARDQGEDPREPSHEVFPAAAELSRPAFRPAASSRADRTTTRRRPQR